LKAAQTPTQEINKLGVARNLLRRFAKEGKRGGLGTKVPSRVERQSSGWGLWSKPPEAGVSETDANFQLRQGDMHPCPPVYASGNKYYSYNSANRIEPTTEEH